MQSSVPEGRPKSLSVSRDTVVETEPGLSNRQRVHKSYECSQMLITLQKHLEFLKSRPVMF